MRENSLCWSDGLDGIEALEELEAVFEIAFDDEESAAMNTVGDLFDVLLEKLPPASRGKCASAMAFYRLRQALGGGRLTPSSALTFLNTSGAKAILQDLRKKSGLNLPASRHARLGTLGCAVAALGGLALVVALIAFLCHQAGTGAMFLVGAVVTLGAGTVAMRLDKGLLPRDGETLGGLAKMTAAASYGHLVQRGARAREPEMWATMVAALSSRSTVPAAAINRDTTFYKGQMRQAA